jgi:hypothetical protein
VKGEREQRPARIIPPRRHPHVSIVDRTGGADRCPCPSSAARTGCFRGSEVLNYPR